MQIGAAEVYFGIRMCVWGQEMCVRFAAGVSDSLGKVSMKFRKDGARKLSVIQSMDSLL